MPMSTSGDNISASDARLIFPLTPAMVARMLLRARCGAVLSSREALAMLVYCYTRYFKEGPAVNCGAVLHYL